MEEQIEMWMIDRRSRGPSIRESAGFRHSAGCYSSRWRRIV